MAVQLLPKFGVNLYLFLGAQRFRIGLIGTVLSPKPRHIILCLVLVQPRKTGNYPNMTEKMMNGV